MRQLMFCVIPSLYSYSVLWEACSSSTPGIAELGYCYLPLGAPNLVCSTSCVEQIWSCCLWVWDHPGANPWLTLFPTVGPYPTSGTEELNSKLDQKGWATQVQFDHWKASPKNLRCRSTWFFLRKQWTSRLEDGWITGRFYCKWALSLENKLPVCDV